MQRLRLAPRWVLPLLTLTLVAPACGDKDDEDDTGTPTGDGGSTTCGSTQGFVYGMVTGPYTMEPNPAAVVHAVAPDDGEVLAELGGDGSYELNVEGGMEWAIYATSPEGCISDTFHLPVEACHEYERDIHIPDCTTADKPNLYQYPGVDTETTVRLSHTRPQRIVASDPAYPAAGWRGRAHPDGTFTVGQGAAARRAPFLFYEVSLAPWQARSLQRAQGWCLPAGTSVPAAAQAMADLLAAYGFDAREREDFVEAWEHDLPPSAQGYAVSPQLAVDHVADVEIEPALPLSRLWLLVEDGAGCALAAPPVVPFDRRGPHAVEWGVVLGTMAR